MFKYQGFFLDLLLYSKINENYMVFFHYWTSLKSLPNQVHHAWHKSHLWIYKYELAITFLVEGGLDSKFQYPRACIFP
jgi:hypothetical protein